MFSAPTATAAVNSKMRDYSRELLAEPGGKEDHDFDFKAINTMFAKC